MPGLHLAPPESPGAPAGPAQCVTCGKEFAGIYCWNCGEKRIDEHDYSLRHFLKHALEAFTHLDGNIFRSVRSLLIRPGVLTADYIAGKRKLSIAPLQLFLVINVIYFLVQPLIGWNTLTTSLATHLNDEFYSPLARQLVERAMSYRTITLAAFEERFNEISTTHAKSLVIIMVPVFALVLDLLYHRSKRYYVEHLFFALHFYAYLLIVNTIILALTNAVLAALTSLNISHPWQVIDLVAGLVNSVILGVYLYIACRRVYRQSVGITVAKSVGLTLAMVYILRLYRFILFFTTLWSL